MSTTLSALATQKMDQLIELTAKRYNGLPGKTYTATPTIAQELNDKVTEDGNWFLPLINVLPVSDIQGEKLLMGLSGPVTSRTDTSGSGSRVAKSLAALDEKGYQLRKTDTDVAIRYSLIDMWSKFPDFSDRYGRYFRKKIGDDRVIIGFNGTSAAATTDVVANPLLQDVNIGWLQQIREFNSGSQRRVGTVSVPITLGGATFPNLDVLAHDMKSRLAIQFRGNTDLVLLAGDDVLTYQRRKYYEVNGNKPTEKTLLANGQVAEVFGGFPTLYAPHFLDSTLLLTSLNNLSIYWQATSWRRKQEDNAKKDQYEDFNSRNEGYVVENFEMTSLVENITFA